MSRSETQNGIMFRLPRVLKNGDKIHIKGKTQNQPEMLTLRFATGEHSLDDNNACQFEARFNDDACYLEHIVDGKKLESSKLSIKDLIKSFQNQQIKFVIKVRKGEKTYYLDIDVDNSSMGSIALKHHKVNDITFLKLDGDITTIDELKFNLN